MFITFRAFWGWNLYCMDMAFIQLLIWSVYAEKVLNILLNLPVR